MNDTNFDCSMDDTEELRSLILENPDLPILIFCGEESYSGEYHYNQADVRRVGIVCLTLYGDTWMEEDDYKEKLADELSIEEEYEDLSDEDFEKMIDQKAAETEFVKAIVIWVG